MSGNHDAAKVDLGGGSATVDPDLERSQSLLAEGRLTEAIEMLRGVLARDPGNIGALNNLANAALASGRIDEAITAYQSLLRGVGKPLAYRVASNYLLALQYRGGLDDTALRTIAEEIGRQMPAPDGSFAPRAGGSPIRIGFVSADLCDHPVGLFLLPLIRQLDPSQVEIFFYSNGSRVDHTQNQLMGLGQWREVASLPHAAVARSIRNDRIDVLFDLSGHTAGNLLPVFAMRAAPVQISWLGYFATTGVPAMDYVLMDSWHVPDGAEAFFSEKILRLPHARLCYEPVPFAPVEAASPPCVQRGYITFGSFNNTSKLNDQVIATWAAVLRGVPGSRLILKWRTFADAALRERITKAFGDLGVEPWRLELRGQSFHVDVLRQYGDVDIALDPFPFTGGHTSCEALWMGLPVVTLEGTRPVARQTLCFIHALQQPQWALDWIATDTEDYVRKACALAADVSRLREVRRTLRGIMRASPLMDAGRFAADFQKLMGQLVTQSQGAAT